MVRRAVSDPILDTIRAELDRRGWSARELARQADVPHPSITRWLSGERSGVSVPVLLAILDALGMELVIRKRRNGANK